MKTTKILGVTTLAGTLLFTGLGQVNAAESQVTASNAVNIADSVTSSNLTSNYLPTKDKGTYYFIGYQNKSGSGVGGIRVYKDGTVKMAEGVYGADDNGKYFTKMGKYDLSNNQNQNQNNTNNIANQNNGSLDTNNSKKKNNTQSQDQNQTLPETGETSTNTTLITMIASVILAAGSLLTFRRTSK
ncbi:LPXTG-motif cell wall-anchored protein [Staphylococcus epidermidis]|uniref:LPXTG cell wall anchor domain-containing protein n=1 Tax=Staphylococcus epidermidis TaxID=1282 RepID=UPI001931A90E|nr:LPXTG cell wall anchor domain-containing protein [Staphylococcus epidermidis]MBM0752543.1 LPXTG cell wall anchor domain-containing protein [Staphylococcus epidermidis]MBM0765241.1 LPXTG cell wall anchor domain-containing protein [Staphylococcus epidermidis]MBM0789516.1 LPXTG cell wall anchor domain-containing protein [Staphylococcus epidermidis]